MYMETCMFFCYILLFHPKEVMQLQRPDQIPPVKMASLLTLRHVLSSEYPDLEGSWLQPHPRGTQKVAARRQKCEGRPAGGRRGR